MSLLSFPLLGFGAMRLPQDVGACKTMFAQYLDSGFNYFDTAYMYENSENMLKKALVSEHPRRRFLLADKLPLWHVRTLPDCDRLLNESFKRCGVDYFDAYLLHAVNASHERKIAPLGVYEWAAGLKKKGLCRLVGFSFHDDPAVLDTLLSAHPEMDFVQLQLNYVDNLRGQAGTLHEIALKHKKPIIVMEPVKGGTLATLPPAAEAVFKAAQPNKSAASWAMRYAASLEGVVTVLSGMSNAEQVADNIAALQPFTPLTAAEYAVIEQALTELTKVYAIPCTACKYCVADCPQHIEIPTCFSIFNERQRGSAQWNQNMLYRCIPAAHRASGCIACGICKPHCPQGIDIPARLAEVAKELE